MTRLFWHLLLALPAILVTAADKEDKDACTLSDGDHYFDLKPLRSKSDYEAEFDTGDTKITLNVCGPVHSETWKLDDPETVGGFYRGAHGDLSIGRVNTTLRISHGNPLLVLTNGSPCQNEKNSLKRSSAIRFICDKTVFGSGRPKLIAKLPPDEESACAFFFEWRTHVACPTSKGGGAGGAIAVFGSIAFIALLAYIVGATIYNRFVLGLRGFDQLPRISFFSFSDTKDLFKRWRSRQSSQYQQYPTWGSWRNGPRGGDATMFGGPEDREGMMGDGGSDDGRFSIDENDEGARDNQILSSGIPPPGNGVIRL